MAGKIVPDGAHRKFQLGQNADINVTPFVDVMLVLLIIFMVSAPLATLSIKLDLPPATPPKDPNVKPKPPVVISLQKTGVMYLGRGDNMHPELLDNLTADLPAVIGRPDPKEEIVFIRADTEVKYLAFMNVVNKLQDGGYYKIALITEDIVG